MSNLLPKLCLNMIVKNESKIITRLLDSVIDIIDSYCICDTGSVDGTVKLIEEYFKENGKPGKIISESFKDFGYNRTHSLLACQGEPDADYILFMDADMILEKGSNFNLQDFKKGLEYAPAHYIFQGSATMSYKNVRIVKNNIGVTYWGVTHEYIKMPESCSKSIGSIEKNILFINDVGDGGAKVDKFERDIRLLLKGLEDVPNNDRYTFYLANSYKENGQREKAIEMYKKRIELGGWIEEIWYSYYNIGKCYMILGEPEKAIANWLEAYDKFPKRLENIYEIMAYYRTKSKHRLVYEFYKIARRRLDEIGCGGSPEGSNERSGASLDHLFVQNDIYDYKIDYEYTISGYYYNPDKIDIVSLFMKVLKVPSIESGIIKNMMSNYKFYVPKLNVWKDIDMTGTRYLLPPDFHDIIGKIVPIADLTNSTPTFCHLDDGKRSIINTRHVNYRIGEKGEYINKEKIITKNMITIYNNNDRTIEKEFELKYNRDGDGLYVGLEDVRMIEHKNEIYFTANRGFGSGMMFVEYGKINIETEKATSSILLKTDGKTNIEKNWVLFETADRDALRIVYNWYPMTTYSIENNGSLSRKETRKTPRFFENLRGSTNGIRVDDETWFICHLVSYDDRRYYYHIIVAIDAETGNVNRWSKFFTFEGQSVEYILGFTYNELTKMFLFGYSTMDSKTEYRKTSKDVMLGIFV
jgi:tetratricopeptide (TPR) repeat protein